MPPSAALDHIIFVTTLPQIQRFRDAGFEVVLGGTHADGITANALIVLQDIYLELVYFVKPDPQHWWSDKRPGAWADFALMPLEKDGSTLFTRDAVRPDGSRVYRDPVEGGRRTEEGVELRWKVTFVDAPKNQRGRLPFLCEDVTPRSNRVTSHRDHPNGAQRIHKLLLLSKPDQLSKYKDDLQLIVGNQLKGPAGYEVKLEVREPASSKEKAWVEVNGEGVYEVVLETTQEAQPMDEGIAFVRV